MDPPARWRCALSALAAAMTCWLVIADIGYAATATVRRQPGNRFFADLHYRAQAGEVNRVEITIVDKRTLRLSDAGAVITPGTGCRTLDLHTVRCTTTSLSGRPGMAGANVRLADQDDLLHSFAGNLEADAGPGDDTVDLEGEATGIINGGGGRDTLLGGSNVTEFIDGDVSGSTDSDVMDARSGEGIVSYEGRTAPVVVDVSGQGPDGEAGESDVLRSVIGAVGGAADDTLLGDGERNVLNGGAGADHLVGFAGQDSLSGGPGADRLAGLDDDDSLSGGAGPDRISGGSGDDVFDDGSGDDRLTGGAGDDSFYLYGGGQDAVACGEGDVDAVANPSGRDTLEPGCEEASFSFGPRKDTSIDVQVYPVRRSRHRLVLELGCPTSNEAEDGSLPMSGHVVLRARLRESRALGSGRIPARAGRRCARDGGQFRRVSVAIALTTGGEKLLSRPSSRRLVVSLRGRNLPRASWTIRADLGARQSPM